MTHNIDRNDPAQAAEIMKDLCPSKADRALILERLLDSIEIADAIGPDTYAVTLFGNGFRLNVGAVEALTFLDGEVGVFLHGPISEVSTWRRDVHPCDLANAPQPAHFYLASLSDFRSHSRDLDSLHVAYIRGAAVTSRGKPRRATYGRYHSPGLVVFARTVIRPRRLGAGA